MNDKHKLLLVGAGAHSHVVIDILLQNEEYDIIGCLDYDYDENHKRVVYGIPVIGNDEKLQEIYKNGITKIHIALGDNKLRSKLFSIATAAGFEPVSIISRNAVISPRAIIGRGTVIMPGAVINAGAEIGDNCIINTNCSIDHDCIIESHCHIAPGCALSGNVEVGEGTHIGTGSCVIDRIKIGAWSYIGAGSVVVKDIEPGILAYGNPARKIREITKAGSV
jgi:UDP-perosamine 4-acetyltransferase